MSSMDSQYFRELPPFTSDIAAVIESEAELLLLLLEHIDIGKSVIFPVQYKHRELIFRSPGKKDAVAFGVARLEHSGEFRDVRILFSRVHETATLKGLALEGQVKLGPTSRSTRSRAKTRAPG